MIKDAGPALSPEKCIVVDLKDNPCTFEGKADAFHAAEGRRLERVIGESSSHHRNLRPRHVFKHACHYGYLKIAVIAVTKQRYYLCNCTRGCI
jgi:hypothetical protein